MKRRNPLSASWVLFLGLASLMLLAAACGSGTAGEDPPPPAADEPPRIVTLTAEEIAPGFAGISYYHDIPGLLRELEDPILSALGERARQPQMAGGQGFANTNSGQLVFTIAILHESADLADAVVQHIRDEPPEAALAFISPDETLFEAEREPAGPVGDGSVRLFLRYGAERNGDRPRDVSSEVLVFSQGSAVVFVLRSASTADLRTASEGDEAADIMKIGFEISRQMRRPAST